MIDGSPPADGPGEPFGAGEALDADGLDADGLEGEVAGLDRELAAWLSGTADPDDAPETESSAEVERSLEAEPSIEAEAEPSAATEPSAEALDIDAEVAGDLVELAQIERDLGDVDGALRRLDAGTYGTCTSCGAIVDAALLADEPLRDQCPRCAAGAEASSG